MVQILIRPRDQTAPEFFGFVFFWGFFWTGFPWKNPSFKIAMLGRAGVWHGPRLPYSSMEKPVHNAVRHFSCKEDEVVYVYHNNLRY